MRVCDYHAKNGRIVPIAAPRNEGTFFVRRHDDTEICVTLCGECMDRTLGIVRAALGIPDGHVDHQGRKVGR